MLEAAEVIGSGVSSRNSEVIHAGLYYPTGSLKARLCVAGRDALYAYCAERAIGHRRCGKLLVATDESQVKSLLAIRDQALANGVADLSVLSAEEARKLEPSLRCVAALWSPSTGIIDSHALMLAYQGDAEAAGATVVCRAPVTGMDISDDFIAIHVDGDDSLELRARTVVNSAGLDAPGVAQRTRGLPAQSVPRAYYAKGNYFALQGVRAPFQRLIYPMPSSAGLGIHLTLDLAGQARFGPDVEWVEDLDYDVDAARAESFYEAIRAYWPELPADALVPAYSGIRPKVVPRGAASADFVIQGPRDHGIARLVNLFGIESPGLTASLALAGHVAALLE